MTLKGAGGGEGHDVEQALDELFTTPPPVFVSRRQELAARAKAAGRVADARRIRAAHRPSLAAWAANLLLRSQPEESRRFLELGRALREAYQSLDADGIKELSEQRRSVVFALSRQAGELAREAGHPLSDTVRRDVESTLRAVLADQDAAGLWATGRLESALVPPTDFPARAAAGPLRKPAAPPSSRTRAKDEVAEKRRQKQEEQLGRAREAAKTAEQRLRQAREELRRAEREQQEAEERRRSAAEAVAGAEQAARDAAQEVERLSGPVR
ncbi:hypothetical protein JIX56_08740 [Streptomyces sp. CA-210063]|uniref:hypothetical protein n=1 Tax=Streptomyces sp. CA-210063 TaxID=2801029 RepID=UPI00214AD1FA|nr:hypothetical protein [Streptomyces sp. CA-210063]UUU29965.1 hypothetical protein JIX56_08740 [Streptomyces sp. CA-210063]